MSSSELISEFPRRLKIYLVVVALFFVFGYFSLIIIEEMSAIDAFYFLIVTVSTVGFGDITVETTYSKVLISVLIIISISSIALLSEQIVSRLVELNTSRIYDLPSHPLEYSNHIIICGFTKVAENVALLFQGRFFRIIILDPHAVAVQRARNYGLEAYLARPELYNTLQTVNITDALALYLFMDDENKNVLTSLQARSLHEDLLIYASTDHELSIDLGNLIGIDRTYHYERIVASNISFALEPFIAFSLPNQLLSADAQFFLVLVSKEFPLEDHVEQYFPVGILDKTLTEFTPIEKVTDIDAEMDSGALLMVTLLRSTAEQLIDESLLNTPIIGQGGEKVQTVIIGGYNDTARHIIHELDPSIIKDFEFKVLTFSEENAAQAREDGYQTTYIHREDIEEVFSTLQSSSVLMVNLFDRLTDSLLVNTVIRKFGLNVFIVQLAFNRIETDVLIKSGSDRILIPDVMMSRGMFQILLSTKNLIHSTVWGNTHMFEHYVDSNSPLRGKRIRDIRNLGYHALLYQTPSGKIREHVDDLTLQLGSNVLLYRDHQFLRSAEQFIDRTHH